MNGLPDQLASAFMGSHPDAAARALEDLPPEQAVAVLADASPPDAASTLRSVVPIHTAGQWLAGLPPAQYLQIARELPPEVLAQMLSALREKARAALVEQLPEALRNTVQARIRYPLGSVGAKMQPAVLAVPDSCSVREALSRVSDFRGAGHSHLYVVARDGVLRGYVTLRELMRAAPEDGIVEIMLPAAGAVRGHVSVIDAFARPGAQGLGEVPVVDRHGALRGVLLMEATAHAGENGPTGSLEDLALAAAELYWVGLCSLWLPARQATHSKRERTDA